MRAGGCPSGGRREDARVASRVRGAHHARSCPEPEAPGHILGRILAQSGIVGDLAVAELQSSPRRARDPWPQGVVTPGEDGAGQLRERPLGAVPTRCADLGRITMWARRASGPVESLHDLNAVLVVQELNQAQ